MSHTVKKPVADQRQEWVTPDDFFEVVEREFDLDVCATRENAKYPLYFSLENGQDGLKESWTQAHAAWCNPAIRVIPPCGSSAPTNHCIARVISGNGSGRNNTSRQHEGNVL